MPYEDWPMWINITRAGIKMHYLNVAVVNYRRHSSSQYNYGEELIFNDFFLKTRVVYKKYVKENLKLIERFNISSNYYSKLILIKLKLRNKNKINKSIFYLISKIFKSNI